MEVKDFISKYAVSRENTNSVKWDIESDPRFAEANLTPMWVADMEFRVPDEVIEALHKRVDHGIFGYTHIWDSYFDAFSAWQKKRYNIDLEREWMSFSPGVVTGFYWAVQVFTEVNDNILTLNPVYYPFHSAVKDNNRNLITCELKNDNGIFTIDYDKLENTIKENNVKLIIFCNPHNPVGRVWTNDEIENVFEICKRHNVYIISDEIHQDINLGIRPFISAFSIKNKDKYIDRLIVFTAPSKTFNMASLLNSHVFIPNEELRKKYKKFASAAHRTDFNLLGLIAAEAAYRHGEYWLEGLLNVIKYNFEYIKTQLNQNVPDIIISPLEGTYLPFFDLRKVVDINRVKEFIQTDCRIAVDFGEWFGENSKGFIRLNIATDTKYVEFFTQQVINNLKNKKYK